MAASFYFDTSALVKRYVSESGTEWVRELLLPTEEYTVFTAQITGAEALSALVRRRRRGELTEDEFDIAKREFRAEFESLFYRIRITLPLIRNGMDLIERHGLRGYDGIQLAAALEANRILHERKRADLTFVSADDNLNTAAHAEGLPTENPNAHV